MKQGSWENFWGPVRESTASQRPLATHVCTYEPTLRITNILQLQTYLLARLLQTGAFQNRNESVSIPQRGNQMC